jgi:hypothetical protein
MSVQQQPRDHRRFRLATNDNETVIDELDVEGNSLTRNDTETLVVDDDEYDTEGHRLAANDNEITAEGMRRLQPDDDEELTAPGLRRDRAR